MDSTQCMDVSRIEDSQLVEQARKGNRAAFDQLFQLHKPFIYNVCYRMLGTADDAIDATQTAFIQAYNSLRGFKGNCAFRTWLYRIAVNVCTAVLRQKQRRNLLSLEIDPEQIQAKSDDKVWEAMLELNPPLRAVLVLFYFQGLSGEEIAQALGCSEGAVRTRMHRAREAFKQRYEEICNEL